MDCEHFSALLDDLRDGRLDAPAAADAKAHLTQCPRCRTLYQMTKDLSHLDADASVPKDFRARWQSRTREEKRRRTRALQSILSAAAAVLFVMGGTALRRSSMAQTEHLPNVAMMRMAPMPASGGGMDALVTETAASPILEKWSAFAHQAGDYLADAWPFMTLAGAAVLGYFVIKLVKKHRKG